MDVTIRNAVLSDIQAIMDISESILRKISFDETCTWMRVDPEGILVAETNDSQIIGTCCAIRLSADEGFAGLFWVAEDYRNQGIGTKLSKAALQHLGDRNVSIRRIQGHDDSFTNKSKFPYVGDNILIFECRGHSLERRPEHGVRVATLLEGRLMEVQVGQGAADEIDADCGILTTEDMISKVNSYHKSLSPIDLSVVIRELFFWRSSKVSIALSSGKVIGFGCLRPVVTGHWLVSPFYADTESVAEVILYDLLHGFHFSQTSKGFWVRFPEKNAACIRLLKKFHFQHVSFNMDTRSTKHLIIQDASKIYSYFSVTFCTD